MTAKRGYLEAYFVLKYLKRNDIHTHTHIKRLVIYFFFCVSCQCCTIFLRNTKKWFLRDETKKRKKKKGLCNNFKRCHLKGQRTYTYSYSCVWTHFSFFFHICLPPKKKRHEHVWGNYFYVKYNKKGSRKGKKEDYVSWNFEWERDSFVHTYVSLYVWHINPFFQEDIIKRCFVFIISLSWDIYFTKKKDKKQTWTRDNRHILVNFIYVHHFRHAYVRVCAGIKIFF